MKETLEKLKEIQEILINQVKEVSNLICYLEEELENGTQRNNK